MGIIYVLTGHIPPHHATYLAAWGQTLAKARVAAGMDADEAFTDPDQKVASTLWLAGGKPHGIGALGAEQPN